MKNFMKWAKHAPPDCKLPCRNAVGGKSLDKTCKVHQEKDKEKLHNQDDVFGLQILGDGATIGKKPLLNVVAQGAHMPASCQQIVDCADHLELGGKKDAQFTANQFIPFIALKT